MENVRIEILLQEVINQRASDLHLQVGLPPILRVDGSLAPIRAHTGSERPLRRLRRG